MFIIKMLDVENIKMCFLGVLNLAIAEMKIFSRRPDFVLARVSSVVSFTS